MWQSFIHIELRIKSGFTQQLFQQERFIASGVPPTNGEIRLLSDVDMGIEEQRRETLILGRSSVFLFCKFASVIMV
jgi:hypothetical protein